MSKDTRYWFPAKRYGWGWGLPSTWEGWVVMGTYVVSLAISAQLLPESPTRFAISAALTTGVLIVICFVKGEPPSWRWGDDK